MDMASDRKAAERMMPIDRAAVRWAFSDKVDCSIFSAALLLLAEAEVVEEVVVV